MINVYSIRIPYTRFYNGKLVDAEETFVREGAVRKINYGTNKHDDLFVTVEYLDGSARHLTFRAADICSPIETQTRPEA